jgi:hypothetical protein
MQAGVPQGSVLTPILFNICIYTMAPKRMVFIAVFADNTCLYAVNRKEGFVRKLQRYLISMETWCELWN